MLDGLPGAVDIASAIPPDPTVTDAEVDAAAAAAAAERAKRVAAEAAGAYDELAAARDAARRRAGRRRLRRRRPVRDRRARAGRAHRRRRRPLRRRAGRPAAGGRAILDAVAPTLTGLPNVLRVEGHANHLPVTAGRAVAVELGAVGATARRTVLRHLAGDGVPEPRMSATGYSSTRPLVPDTDPTAITVNRRVDIVVLSTASAEANALLPGIDAAHQGATA